MKLKKCETGVKKMKLNSYQGGSKKIKAATDKIEDASNKTVELNKIKGDNGRTILHEESNYNSVSPKGGVITKTGITEYSNGRAYRHSDGAKGNIVYSDKTAYKGKDGKYNNSSTYKWDSYDIPKDNKTTDVSVLKQNVDLNRAVKNSKNTSDGRPMYQGDVRKEAQRRITNDSTQLAKKGYPKYAEGSKGIFSKKRKDDAELEANIIDAGDAIAKQVETPKSTISSVAVTPKKMNLLSRLKRNQEEGNAYAASIDAEDEVIADKNAKSVKVNSTNEDLETGQYSKPKESENEELDRVASSTPQIKTNISKGADAKLAEWQRKRGLKADGIWGKESEAAYKKEQAKKMKFNTPTKSVSVSKISIPESTKVETKPTGAFKDTSFNSKVGSYIPKEVSKKTMTFNTKAIDTSKLHKPITKMEAPKEKPSPFVTNSAAERKAALKKSPGVGNPIDALDRKIMGEGYERDSSGKLRMKKGYTQVNGKAVKTSSATKK